MADHVAISIIHDTAINTLMAEAASISTRLEIAPPVMPDFNNATYQQAMRLRALADWLTTVNAALNQEPSPNIEGSLAIDVPSPVTEGGDSGNRKHTKA